jgi:hypothetical protein
MLTPQFRFLLINSSIVWLFRSDRARKGAKNIINGLIISHFCAKIKAFTLNSAQKGQESELFV